MAPVAGSSPRISGTSPAHKNDKHGCSHLDSNQGSHSAISPMLAAGGVHKLHLVRTPLTRRQQQEAMQLPSPSAAQARASSPALPCAQKCHSPVASNREGCRPSPVPPQGAQPMEWHTAFCRGCALAKGFQLPTSHMCTRLSSPAGGQGRAGGQGGEAGPRWRGLCGRPADCPSTHCNPSEPLPPPIPTAPQHAAATWPERIDCGAAGAELTSGGQAGHRRLGPLGIAQEVGHGLEGGSGGQMPLLFEGRA